MILVIILNLIVVIGTVLVYIEIVLSFLIQMILADIPLPDYVVLTRY